MLKIIAITRYDFAEKYGNIPKVRYGRECGCVVFLNRKKRIK